MLHRPTFERYSVGVLAVVGAVAVRLALAPLLQAHAPLLLFALSVMIAGRYGGVGPGLLATFLSAVIGVYFFIQPYNSFGIANAGEAAYLGVFAVVGMGISFLNGQLRRALEQSDQARSRFQTLSEAVPQLVWTCEPEGSCDYLNGRWVEYTGIPAAAQFGYAWLEQVHPDDRARVLQAWRSAVAGDSNFQIVMRIRRGDGAYRWFDTRAVALHDSAGRILKWFGSNTDIHEEHEAREALRIEQERISRIAATAPGVICSFRLRPDGTSCFPYASPRIEDIYGVRPESLIEDSTPAFRAMHPDDADRVRQSVVESASTMLPWRAEFRVHNPTRGEIWVEGHSQPARNPDGSVEWYGFIADITARHRTDQALRERTAKLEELTRTLDLAHAFVRNLDGTITYWSQGAAVLYGWSPAEAIGRSCHELLRTEFPASLDEIQAHLLATGRWEGELRHYRRDGSLAVVASDWALHLDDGGVPRSVIEVNNDISRQKRAEADLRTSEQRLELAQATAGVGTWDWDLLSNETYCSDAFGQLFGLPNSHHGPTSEEWLAMIHPEDRDRVRLELERALEGSATYDTEFRVGGAESDVRWLMGKGQVYRDAAGRPVRMLAVNIDITERKAAADQLRALSASLILAQEEERRRVSRELHDDLTQRLCLMAIDLGRLTSNVPSSAPQVIEEIRMLQERAVQAAELTRHVAHELHPSILDELGIATALRSYCDEFARREEIQVEFASVNLPPTIKRETASCLYAVAQEAMLNISKHARARHVIVDLQGMEDSIRLLIADDGIGFPCAPGAPLGLGVLNMRERVRWVKGTFSIASEPGGGARVTVVVPVERTV